MVLGEGVMGGGLSSMVSGMYSYHGVSFALQGHRTILLPVLFIDCVIFATNNSFMFHSTLG